MLNNFDPLTKIFHNLNKSAKPKNLLDVIKWKYYSKKASWPKQTVKTSYDLPPSKFEGSEVRISYIGHVTFLIQVDGINILTDPVWSNRVSPISFLGPKRVSQPGVHFKDLPKIDYVLVSHNHYDHLDISTLKKLCERDQPQIITPLGNDQVIKSHIPQARIITLNWEENYTPSSTNTNSVPSFSADFAPSFRADSAPNIANISFHLEPAQHWSARGLFDRNKCLWGSFIIKTKQGSICFIGDSGYCPTIFKDIGNKFNDILVSLIPIGAAEPRWFMRDVHMNPEEAIFTYEDLQSKYAIASHFNVFPLADDHFNQPNQELKECLKKYNISEQSFCTPEIGNAYYFNRLP